MAVKPKVFVTRIIPQVGLDRIKAHCDAEIWTDPLPPPYAVIRQKVARCDGLVALLTDKIDAALLDAAPSLKVVSNYAVGFNNIDIAAATERGIAVGNTPGVLTDATADMAFALLISAGRRIGESEKVRRSRAVEDLGTDGAHRTGHGRPHVGYRRHGPHRLCDGAPVSRGLGHAGLVSRSEGPRAGRERIGRRARRVRSVAGRLGLHLRAYRLERHHPGHVQRRGVCQDEAHGGVCEHGPRAA